MLCYRQYIGNVISKRCYYHWLSTTVLHLIVPYCKSSDRSAGNSTTEQQSNLKGKQLAKKNLKGKKLTKKNLKGKKIKMKFASAAFVILLHLSLLPLCQVFKRTQPFMKFALLQFPEKHQTAFETPRFRKLSCEFLGPREPLETPSSDSSSACKKKSIYFQRLINHSMVTPEPPNKILMLKGQFLLLYSEKFQLQ